MISYVIGDLFESPAQTLVNTVNTVGVMGKGIALKFKRRYPAMFAEYRQLCDDHRFQVGSLFIYRTSKKLILNFPTKENWRRPSKIEWIERGLQTFVGIYRDAGIHSVAFPPLGCGNGELRYDEVRPLMEKYLADLPIPIYLYPPRKATAPAEHRAPLSTTEWLNTRPADLSFSHVWLNDIQALLRTHPQIRLLGTHQSFSAEWLDTGTGEAIGIRMGSHICAIAFEDAKYIWRELVANPLITASAFTSSESKYLFAILALLPYVRSFVIADTYEELQEKATWSLQLIPAPAYEEKRRITANV